MKNYVKASTNSDIRSGIIDAIDRASNTDPNVGATTWYELAETSDKIWAFVCAWLDLDGDGEYRLMGKIAYMPTRSAMSDYDYDWMMPYKENEDVYDTELEIDPYGDINFDVDWWLDQWEEIKKIYVYPEEDYDEDIESATKINCVGHNEPGKYFDLIDYFDVWGNEEDGWEVNDQTFIEKDIWISDDTTEEELFNYLKDTIGYFNRTTKFSDVDIQWTEPEFIEIFDASNGYPLCRLQESYRK